MDDRDTKGSPPPLPSRHKAHTRSNNSLTSMSVLLSSSLTLSYTLLLILLSILLIVVVCKLYKSIELLKHTC